MAKTVLVFRAGASVGAGAPLMPKFIDAADDLKQERNPSISANAFDLFFDVLQNRLPLLHAKSVVDLGNIESVFGLVEMGRLVGRLPGTPTEDIDAIAHATRRVLAETVENLTQFEARDGQWVPPQDYSSVAEWIAGRERLGRQDSIALITFNYDLALDFALHWSDIPYSYCLDESANRGHVPLLKLHGSLNWAACPKCTAIRVLGLERLFQLDSRRVPRDGSARRTLRALSYLKALGPHCEDAPASLEPAIVPPSWNKTQYHESFGRIWRRAALELSEAQEVHVIGYSLPPTDSFFRDLLALGLVGSSRLKKFEVVNPDDAVATRFRELLGPECKNRFESSGRTFSDWAKTNFGTGRLVRFV